MLVNIGICIYKNDNCLVKKKKKLSNKKKKQIVPSSFHRIILFIFVSITV